MNLLFQGTNHKRLQWGVKEIQEFILQLRRRRSQTTTEIKFSCHCSGLCHPPPVFNSNKHLYTILFTKYHLWTTSFNLRCTLVSISYHNNHQIWHMCMELLPWALKANRRDPLYHGSWTHLVFAMYIPMYATAPTRTSMVLLRCKIFFCHYYEFICVVSNTCLKYFFD